jgi:hypothetical protein
VFNSLPLKKAIESIKKRAATVSFSYSFDYFPALLISLVYLENGLILPSGRSVQVQIKEMV